MQQEMKLSELRTLLISAKNELNSMLSLDRTKKIKYEEKQYFELITFLSLWNAAGGNGSKIMNIIDEVPSGAALMQQLQKLKTKEVEEQFNTIFDKQFFNLIKKKRRKAIVIIDVHEQETYSKDKKTSKHIRGGKHKNGTNYFFKFATIQIVVKDLVLTLAVKFYPRKKGLVQIVNQLVKIAKKYVRIKTLLLDRGFRDTKILNDLEFLQIPMLMPCIKDKKTRREFEKAKRNFHVVKYCWRNSKGEFADFKLMVMKLNNGKEIGFYTTLRFVLFRTIKYYLDLYAKRWNIETGYRLQNLFLPKTTCIKGVVRYFYFCYAVAMHNLWLCAKNSVKGTPLTVLAVKFILVYFWITTHLVREEG
jgi:hypothetical protein